MEITNSKTESEFFWTEKHLALLGYAMFENYKKNI